MIVTKSPNVAIAAGAAVFGAARNTPWTSASNAGRTDAGRRSAGRLHRPAQHRLQVGPDRGGPVVVQDSLRILTDCE